MSQVLGLGKLGVALFVISIILIIGVYYVVPDIENFFDAEILLEGKNNTNFFIRLYAGFLSSSAMMLSAQFIVWLLAKAVIINGPQYREYLDNVKTVRNFSFYAVMLLVGLLFLITGKTFQVM